jgi:hypothetical protein
MGTEVTDAPLQPASAEHLTERADDLRQQHPGGQSSVSPAAELGRRGGVARARKLSRERRVEIARHAAARRWGKRIP